MAKKTIFTYYTILFCFNLSISFFFGTYVIFLTEAGLSLVQVTMVNAAFMFTCFALEIPTGSVADNYGRKISFILSCIFFSLSMLVYYYSSIFIMFVVAEMIAALAQTLSSGAFEAWVVDSVKHYDESYDMAHIFEKKIWVKSAAILIGVITGSRIGQIDIALPWLMSSIGMLIVAVIAYVLMKEEYFDFKSDTEKGWSSMKRTVKDSIHYGIKHKEVFYISLTGVVFSFACMAPNMFWQIRFKDLGVSVGNLGFIHAGTVCAIFLGTIVSRKTKKYFSKEKYSLLFSLALFAAGMIVASQFQVFPIVLCGFYIHEIARGVYEPLRDYYVNKKIPSNKRATILSFVSMVAMIGAFAGLVVTGNVAEHISVSAAWLTSAIAILISFSFLYLFKNGE